MVVEDDGGIAVNLDALVPEQMRKASQDAARKIASNFDLPQVVQAFPAIAGMQEVFGDIANRFASMIAIPDVTSALTRFQSVDLGLKIDVSPIFSLPQFESLKETMARFAERLREALPPNWPEDFNIDEMLTVIEDDGIPLVWVPRSGLVTELLGAADRAERLSILLHHEAEVIADCREVLADVSSQVLTGQVPLAYRALDAFEAGQHEAAQALAVVVTETAVARWLGRSYDNIIESVAFDMDSPFMEVRVRAALAPIGPFYTAWWPSSGDPAPTELSRHVSVHQADSSHYTDGNGFVAVMLASSVLRALQEIDDLSDPEPSSEGQAQK
jgi:uncharacterized protein (UPF0147 family)